MEVIYRPLLPPTQYCPCSGLQTNSPNPSSPSNQPTPFFRTLFAPYVPLWIDPAPATTDNSSDSSAPSQQADINYRTTFERQQRNATRSADAIGLLASLYMPKGRWHWTYQIPFEDRPEQVPISSKPRYSLSIRTARMYHERITYVRKLWPRGIQWEGFFSEVWLHKNQLRPLHGTVTPALIGIHSNIDGIQMTYDIPHHSFWIQASPDMPLVLKRRCLDAYHQLHGQGVLHGSVDPANILIGGDGQVKIVNFEKSRSDREEPRVGLRPATPQDFKMEMREVHYKLDYQGAREKELSAWENRHDIHQDHSARKPRNKTLYDRAPYTVSLEPPIEPSIWSIPDNWKPTRFVVPGQSLQQFEGHLNKFLLELDEPDGLTKRALSSPHNLSPPEPPSPPSGRDLMLVGSRDLETQGTNQRYNLRKRKQREVQSDDSDDEPSAKKVRFLAVTQHDDGSKGEVRSPLRPGVKRQVPRTPREHKKLEHHLQGEHRPETKLVTYNPVSHSPCPEIPPRVNYEEFFSAWQSSRARSENHRRGDSGDSNEDKGKWLIERASGKRRQTDEGDSRENDSRQPKRLRRSETTIWECNSLDTSSPTSSTSKVCQVVQPRRSTRSSTRGSHSQLAVGDSRSDKVSRTPKRVNNESSSGGSTSSSSTKQPPLSPLTEYGLRGMVFDMLSDRSGRSSGNLPTVQKKERPLSIQVLNSATTSHVLEPSITNWMHIGTSQLRETTNLQSSGESPATTDSFESIPLVYEEPTQIVPPTKSPQTPTHTLTENSGSWQEPTPMGMARSVAGRLPSSILTIASKVKRGIVGLW